MKILILDYSTDRSETGAIRRWLPDASDVTALYVDEATSLPDGILEGGFTHVIHSGSALSIVEEAPFTGAATALIRSACDNGLAQFGVCYGHQLLCRALLGETSVRSSPNGIEAGWNPVTFTNRGRDLLGVREIETVWQSHFDEVVSLPEGSELLATNAHSRVQAFINTRMRILGTQFHPEFDREAGNGLFLKDRELLAAHGLNADDLVARGPSLDTGHLFFGAILSAL